MNSMLQQRHGGGTARRPDEAGEPKPDYELIELFLGSICFGFYLNKNFLQAIIFSSFHEQI